MLAIKVNCVTAEKTDNTTREHWLFQFEATTESYSNVENYYSCFIVTQLVTESEAETKTQMLLTKPRRSRAQTKQKANPVDAEVPATASHTS